MQLLKNINDLAYGNLDRESLEYLNKKSIFSNYTDMFMDTPYPNIQATEKDIQAIIDIQNEYIKRPNWNKYKKFIASCDSDIEKVLYTRLNEIGVPYTKKDAKDIEQVQEDLGGMIMVLKKHYNRPRPFQVAYYTGQMLHPFTTISGNTPAYPSGHACQSRFLLKIVASKYPKFKKQIKKLADDIAFTRIVMGVHYPRDNKFGFEIADKLATMPSIRDKYFGGKK